MFRDLLPLTAGLPPRTWSDVRHLAEDLRDLAVLPVIGAGASIDCRSPRSTELAEQLYQLMRTSPGPIPAQLSDLAAIRGDLGKMAEATCLRLSQQELLEALGFEDAVRWPGAQDAFRLYDKSPWHPCAYRVLARMAKEGFLTEGVTFNYDCHYEGALLKEGFFPNTRTVRHNQWPEVFTVVANAETHSSVTRRGDFVLNKVHGCVEAWRDAADRGKASDAVIIRWRQLLDWREDRWSRDLFRDRARSNVLVLLGFSGLDAVIQSTLQGVMREFGDGLRGPSRLRVIDRRPKTLALTLIAKAGRGDLSDTQVISLRGRPDRSLAAALLALHTLLQMDRLRADATAAGVDPHIPRDREAMLRRFALTAPAMLRWTWAILESHGASGLAGLRDRRDDYYVPLCADPRRTRRTFAIRDRLALLKGVQPEADAYTSAGSFLTVPARGKAYMPVGLLDHEIEGVANGSFDLTSLSVKLASPAGSLDCLLVGEHEATGKLRGFSLDTGKEVRDI